MECSRCRRHLLIVFFFNDTATTEIYTLSLHDALPISACASAWAVARPSPEPPPLINAACPAMSIARSEEHTSELQSQSNLVCRLLLVQKNYDPGKVQMVELVTPTCTLHQLS